MLVADDAFSICFLLLIPYLSTDNKSMHELEAPESKINLALIPLSLHSIIKWLVDTISIFF